jgi:hypothetical protein
MLNGQQVGIRLRKVRWFVNKATASMSILWATMLEHLLNHRDSRLRNAFPIQRGLHTILDGWLDEASCFGPPM